MERKMVDEGKANISLDDIQVKAHIGKVSRHDAKGFESCETESGSCWKMAHPHPIAIAPSPLPLSMC
jgi:hypothetical protein